ncbi:Kazal-type serine protease inhibitor family protein [Pseudochrobactrum sp. MP213Fo]|uniref:Kazal-type serine protease inhibitor family protein n=1 Tax=Pseudochrobactrum sp. MP213Fo TaxID=3022250 RepID=UPI003BA0CA6D
MGFAYLSIIKRLSAPLAALMVLSACNVSVDEGRPHYPPARPNQPQMCTMEYAPVCGVRNNRERTFANGCQARAEGYRIVNNGQCRSAQTRPPHVQQPSRPNRPERPNRPNGNWGGNHNNNNRPQTACTREYAPVCATNRGRNQTFSNACVARNSGFQVVKNGPCR